MATRILKSLLLLSGLGIIFIGVRFIVTPEIAEAGYGVDVKNNGDFAFHYIKGVRDIFMGLMLLLLLFSNQNKLLGWATFLSSMVPIGDLLIVLSRDGDTVTKAIPHIIAIIVCIAAGLYFILLKKKSEGNMRVR